MYRLTTTVLISLVIVAVALSFFSLISPSPLEIVATAAVFVISVGLSSWLVGYLFSVRAHGESSIITGLILLFIFTPTLSVQMLAIYAFIGMLAGVSKYLLVWRRRHIFNPAALAAFVISLTALAYASWWVATPWLFVPVLLGAVALLYKTNRLLMGLIFMITAGTLFVVSQLLYGETILGSITLIMSWPIVFFAGFMLSEPLTVASKKRHAVIAALVLAVFIAIPIKIGDFLIAPATALLLANIYAAFVSRRATLDLKYVGSTDITPSSKELHFKPGTQASFQAGQYIELTVPHSKADGRGERRMFSITSAPDAEYLSVAMKFYQPSSTYKSAIQKLSKGSVVYATGVYGSFVLPKGSDYPIVLFAGGIGITPFISQIRDLVSQGVTKDITLVYVVASLEEAAYIDELRESGIKIHLKTDRVQLDGLEAEGVSFKNAQTYISGPPAFVRSIKTQLNSRSVKSIKTDYFTGY